MIFCENSVELRIWLVTVHFKTLLSHSDSAIRHKRSLKRLVCLKTYNLLKFFSFRANISSLMRCTKTPVVFSLMNT